jgi:tRNA 2-thiouridine synthesizing protein E
MKVVCDSCKIECDLTVQGPTLLRRALPKGWRPRRIDGRMYILCDVCGNLRQFVGGLSPYLAGQLDVAPNVSIEFPEYTELPDAWLNRTSVMPAAKSKEKRVGRPSVMDINKIITGGGAGLDADRDARAAEVLAWNREKAADLAKSENVELTEPHVEVIRCLQEYYIENGRSGHARELAEMLHHHFAGKGGRKFLYELFPDGPVSQGGRFAGIPVPADAKDTSFGSVL